MDLINNIRNAVIEGDEDLARDIAQEIINSDINLQDVIINGLTAGMKRVGELYEQKEYFIPEIILSADALNAAFEIFKPLLKKSNTGYKGTVIAGVVKGDIHEKIYHWSLFNCLISNFRVFN